MGQNVAVLHLLPHSGGGAGTVLRALLEAELMEGASPIPSIASLERLNETTRCHFNGLGIPWVDCIAMKGGFEKLPPLVKRADIVLVHWWNHPLLMHLLFQGMPPSRLVRRRSAQIKFCRKLTQLAVITPSGKALEIEVGHSPLD